MDKNISGELYIVTGAAGNLGSAIVRQLVRDGRRVRALVLPREEAAKHLPTGAEVFEGDVTDVNTLEPLFKDVQRGTKLYVIHCAAMVSVSTPVADRIWDVNVNGTQNIIDLCLAHNARLAFIGSTGAIPEQPMGVAIREVESYDPEAVTGLYDQTKAAASQLVLDAVRDCELDAFLIMPSGISGPGDYYLRQCGGRHPRVRRGQDARRRRGHLQLRRQTATWQTP